MTDQLLGLRAILPAVLGYDVHVVLAGFQPRVYTALGMRWSVLMLERFVYDRG